MVESQFLVYHVSVRLRAVSIDGELGGALRRGAVRGAVLSAHRHAAYLEAGDGSLIVLAREEAGNGPGLVAVRGAWSFREGPCGLVPGEPFAAVRCLLLIGGGRIAVDAGGAASWDPRLLPGRDGPVGAVVPRARAALETVAARRLGGCLAPLVARIAEVAAGTASPLPGGHQHVEEGVRLLADALAGGEGVADAARRIVGLGDGLTPSCDDLLVGLAGALRLFAGHRRLGAWARAARAALSAAIEEAGALTTPVSRHFLRAAARGRFAERAKDLLEAVRGDGEKTVASAAARVLDYGVTSGADLVFGIALGSLVASRRAKEGM